MKRNWIRAPWRGGLVILACAINCWLRGDCFVVAPVAVGPQPDQYDTATEFPLLIKELSLQSMRFQQVFSASSFTNIDPTCIFVTAMTFFMEPRNPSMGWTLSSLQINLSTTPRAVDHLSTNFADNVGPDDTTVFGPASRTFPLTLAGDRIPILFDRPFRYRPAAGNLLIDVRVVSGSGSVEFPPPALDARNSPTDEVSIAWATNVADTVASGLDTLGVETVLQLSAVPSLLINKTASQADYIVVRWPAQPSVFVLQTSPVLGPGANWQPAGGYDHASETNTLGLSNSGLGSSGFFRLVWESGQPLGSGTLSTFSDDGHKTTQTK